MSLSVNNDCFHPVQFFNELHALFRPHDEYRGREGVREGRVLAYDGYALGFIGREAGFRVYYMVVSYAVFHEKPFVVSRRGDRAVSYFEFSYEAVFYPRVLYAYGKRLVGIVFIVYHHVAARADYGE